MEEEPIRPIIQGRLNRHLTLQHIVKLTTEQQEDLAMFLQRCLTSDCCIAFPDYVNIDCDVFNEARYRVGIDVKVNYLKRYPNKLEAIRRLMVLHRRLRDTIISIMQLNEYHQGTCIIQALNTLNFSGRLYLGMYQLFGYMDKSIFWEPAELPTIKEAIKTIHKEAPRSDYGINDPRTGMFEHVWGVDGSSVMVITKFLEKEDVAKWKFFWESFALEFSLAAADLICREYVKDSEGNLTDLLFHSWWK